MTTIAGLPYQSLSFTLGQGGAVVSSGGPLCPNSTTDLIVVSHGWHMNADASQKLYETLIGNLVQVDAGGWSGAGRTVAVAGVFWPSDQFRDDLGQETSNVLGGHAAAAGGDLHLDVLKRQAQGVGAFLGVTDPDFEKKVLRAVGGGGDADALATLLRAVVTATGDADPQTTLDHKQLMTLPGREIVQDLARQSLPDLHAPAAVAAQGAAAAFVPGQLGGQAQGFFSGAVAGVAKMLNQFAYFELKTRAGRVGQALGGILDAAPELAQARIHLIGHSFGGRLVTSAAQAMSVRKPQSMTLLQAAFSHNSFAQSLAYPPLFPAVTGGYRDVITQGKVKGPIAITHTWHDTAVGVAYPAASRVSQTVSSAFNVSDSFGGAKDVYGGLGSNGALGLVAGEGSQLTYDGASALTLAPGRVSNLLCDFIQNHGDVGRIEAARVVHAALA